MIAGNNNENVSGSVPPAPEPNSSRTRPQSSSQRNAKAKGKRIKAASKPITKAQQKSGPVNFVVTKEVRVMAHYNKQYIARHAFEVFDL